MGHLLLIHESFELGNVVENDRDRILLSFCKMADLAKQENDVFCALSNFFTYDYSFGDIYSGLIYKSWTDICGDKNLKGLLNTTHQLFYNLFIAYPSFAKQIDIQHFEGLDKHKGYAGFEFPTSCNPYIKCEASWHKWKIDWFSQNQNLINWKDDEFLPNKKYSNQILFEEIEKYGKIDKWEKSYKKDTVTAFYEEIMKHKGAGTGKEAYIEEIGKNICLSNFYTFEEDLARKERNATNSFRKIFSISNSNGKKQYISLDFEKGMFEYHNDKGKHGSVINNLIFVWNFRPC